MNTTIINMPEALRTISLENIFPNKERSFGLAQNVSECWLAFSEFMPRYLKELSNRVDTVSVKERLLSIMDEELGLDIGGRPHFELYNQALQEININLKEKTVSSFQLLHSALMNPTISRNQIESFTTGISFGLEIIAEENIAHLLRYSSYNETSEETLLSTIFFKIHLANEIEHIEKCICNYYEFSKDDLSQEAFKEGMSIGVLFWREFWREAFNEKIISA